MEIKIKEITKENKQRYLEQIERLELRVLEDMEKKGRIGQLFITGKEDIENYVDSKDNVVMVAVNEKDEVQSSAYITRKSSSIYI